MVGDGEFLLHCWGLQPTHVLFYRSPAGQGGRVSPRHSSLSLVLYSRGTTARVCDDPRLASTVVQAQFQPVYAVDAPCLAPSCFLTQVSYSVWGTSDPRSDWHCCTSLPWRPSFLASLSKGPQV